MDDTVLDTFHMLKENHQDEISSIDYHNKDHLMASSSYNGDIYIWSIDLSLIVMSFNKYESVMASNRQSKAIKIVLKKIAANISVPTRGEYRMFLYSVIYRL